MTHTAIRKQAEIKFGKLMHVRETRYANEYKLVIKRDQFPFMDRPYMTITCGLLGDSVNFYWGHYDLTYAEALMTAYGKSLQVVA